MIDSSTLTEESGGQRKMLWRTLPQYSDCRATRTVGFSRSAPAGRLVPRPGKRFAVGAGERRRGEPLDGRGLWGVSRRCGRRVVPQRGTGVSVSGGIKARHRRVRGHRPVCLIREWRHQQSSLQPRAPSQRCFRLTSAFRPIIPLKRIIESQAAAVKITGPPYFFKTKWS